MNAAGVIGGLELIKDLYGALIPSIMTTRETVGDIAQAAIKELTDKDRSIEFWKAQAKELSEIVDAQIETIKLLQADKVVCNQLHEVDVKRLRNTFEYVQKKLSAEEDRHSSSGPASLLQKESGAQMDAKQLRELLNWTQGKLLEMDTLAAERRKEVDRLRQELASFEKCVPLEEHNRIVQRMAEAHVAAIEPLHALIEKFSAYASDEALKRYCEKEGLNFDELKPLPKQTTNRATLTIGNDQFPLEIAYTESRFFDKLKTQIISVIGTRQWLDDQAAQDAMETRK